VYIVCVCVIPSELNVLLSNHSNWLLEFYESLLNNYWLVYFSLVSHQFHLLNQNYTRKNLYLPSINEQFVGQISDLKKTPGSESKHWTYHWFRLEQDHLNFSHFSCNKDSPIGTRKRNVPSSWHQMDRVNKPYLKAYSIFVAALKSRVKQLVYDK
jgi:hypothetical protein